MAIFSISDIIIASTLIVNAIALLSAKLVANEFIANSFQGRVKTLVQRIRRYSFIILIWNCLFLFLLAFVFRAHKD